MYDFIINLILIFNINMHQYGARYLAIYSDTYALIQFAIRTLFNSI